MLLERRIGREWDWLTDVGSHVPSEEWRRAYMLWGVSESVDTWMAPGDGVGDLDA